MVVCDCVNLVLMPLLLASALVKTGGTQEVENFGFSIAEVFLKKTNKKTSV